MCYNAFLKDFANLNDRMPITEKQERSAKDTFGSVANAKSFQRVQRLPDSLRKSSWLGDFARIYPC